MAEHFAGIDAGFSPPLMRAVIVDADGHVVGRHEGSGEGLEFDVGDAVADLAVTIDPAVIVLGGAIASAGDLLLDPVRQEFARRVPPGMAEQVRLQTPPLGDHGIAIGAARLAMLARS
jgi:glucokinase